MDELEFRAAVLSVPPVFNEQTALAVLEASSNWFGHGGIAPVEALRQLRLAGLVDEWGDVMRISDPLRQVLRARLATEAPNRVRDVASAFVGYASNGFRDSMVSSLGLRQTAINQAVLAIIAAPPGEEGPVAALLADALAGSISSGRRADGLAAVRQLQSFPLASEGIDRAISFLIGMDAWRDQNLSVAAGWFERVVSEPRRDRLEAIARHLLGVEQERRGEFQKAVENLTVAVELLRLHQDDHGLGQTLTTLGRIYRAVAESDWTAAPLSVDVFSLSTTLLEEAIDIGVALGDRHLEGMALLELARVERRLGNTDISLALVQEATRKLHSSPAELIVAQTLMGSVYKDAGMDAEATEALGVAADLAVAEGTVDLPLARLLNVQASADRRAGRSEEAVRRAQQSVQIGRAIGNDKHIAYSLHTLAAALIDVKQFVDAAQSLAESERLLVELRDRRGLGMVGTTRARLPKKLRED